MKEEIKVLMIVPSLRVSNGVASFSMGYYKKLNHDIVHMDFLSYAGYDSPYVHEIERNGDKVYFLSSFKDITRYIRDCKKVLDNNYQIIHDNCLLKSIPMMKLAKQRVKNRILHAHSTKLGDNKINDQVNRFFLPVLLSTINNRVACSTQAGKAIFSNSSFEIIPNVINVEKFRYRDDVRRAVRKRESCANKIIIGSVGRITEAKNPFFAVDIIENIVKNHPNIEYWWIGNDRMNGKLDSYIRDKGIEKYIRLFGSRDDISELYQAMDLFFLPSEFEGFGLACVEAQTAGLPCVVSNAFAREVDITGETVFIDLNDSKEKWINTIVKCMQLTVDRSSAYRSAENSICSDAEAGERLYRYYSNIIKI